MPADPSSSSHHHNAVGGTLQLSQPSEDAPTVIQGQITGLSPGPHGIAVHTYGDLSQGAASCGDKFNPFGKQHGSPKDQERRVGDLGNIIVDENGACAVYLSDPLMKLLGPHSVIGRSIVVYAGEDDGGKSALEKPSAGPRIAAGVIGIAAKS
jgi:Cu-Zn family superoxide dismutase